MASALVVAAAGFNLPILIWSRNAWDISSPAKLLIAGGVLTLIGWAVLWLIGRFGIDLEASALGVSAALVAFVYWEAIDRLPPVVWTVLVIAVVVVGHRMRDSRLTHGVVLVTIAVVGVAPLVQLVFEHFKDAVPYPVTRAADFDQEPAPTGAVEDVIVVVVDGYPNLRVAADWFGHDNSPLVDRLSGLGFEVLPESWSQHTFTAPSVSALLELQPVIDDRPPGPWGNTSSLYTITRGDSLVSRTLRTAGFSYTHLASAWDVTACGGGVDHCVASPWIDETVAGLIASTALGDWIERRFGNYVINATLHTTDELIRLGEDLTGNGSHEYLFAHLLLPHDPPVVNADCEYEEARVRNDELYLAGEISLDDRRHAISDQMACVDSLLTDIAGVFGSSTAVLITGDHGTATGGQIPRSASAWTDSDVAERFGILLAYRLPPGCEQPDDAISTLVMRAILSCAVTVDLPPESSGHLIGMADPEWVEPNRMIDIRTRVADGTLGPNGN